MKLGFSINAFAGDRFRPFPQKALEIISEAGYRHIELVFDKPYFWLKDLDLPRIAEIKTFLKRHQLEAVDVSSCTAGGYERPDDDVAPPGQRFGPSFADEDESRRRLRVEHVKKVIDFSVMLNCPDINSSTGYQPAGRDGKEAWEDVKKCYREVVRYAAERDAWINIEYEPGKYGPGGLFIANAKDTLKMIEDVGEGNLGVNLDIGHSVVCGENPVEVIKTFAEKGLLRHVHLEDIKDNIHFHEVPGDGDIDFQPIFKAMQEVNYQGSVTLELYSLWDRDPADAAIRSHQYLMSNFGEFFEV